jgi:hypothetical protein
VADPLSRADQIAADLVTACAKLDCLAAFLRWENGEVRIIATAGMYPQLTRMLYRAADVCAAQCPQVKHDPPPR